ncbi:MAG TPA: hypothetical protein VIA61_12995 [Methylomirabilota bacterium]|jgi:signal transduction histidine kinase
MNVMREPSLLNATHEAIDRLQRIEGALERLPTGPEQAPLVGDLTALRETLERLEWLERDERQRLGHDLRVPLNTLAGWTHILRLDATTPGTVQRAVDVFERNVRAMTRLIETYTADPGR